MYEALAFGRFKWKTPEDTRYRVNYDIENRLTRTGWVVVVEGEIIPVLVTDWSALNEVKSLATDDGSGRTINNVRYDDVIKVAPAELIVRDVSKTEYLLRDSLKMQIILSRIPKIVVTDSNGSNTVDAALRSAYKGGGLPVCKMPTGSELPTTISISDGNIHTPELSQAHALNIVTAAQSLGVHTADVIKAERLLADEVEALSEVVDIIAENELAERERLADLLGYRVKPIAKHKNPETVEVKESENDEES